MSPSRSAALQRFLDAAHHAMAEAGGADHPAQPLIETVFAALRRVGRQRTDATASQLPVCEHFATALRNARQGPPKLAALADAIGVLEPHLAWRCRPGAERHGTVFTDNHANARIIGEEGLELSQEVTVGISLMGPHLQYPDHHHPPEEVYIALSSGEWRQGAGAWRAPGIGGLVHNPPGIIHAMRSTEAPLLAVWCLR
jgi:hypothetical protein